MPLYILKSIVWNTENYKRPSGAKFSGGYPKENGYGGEEWNHSDRMIFNRGQQKFRAFNTEAIGNKPIERFVGDVMIFMIASNCGHQYLVAVAGKATALTHEEQDPGRAEIRKQLRDKEFWKDAWSVPTVKAAFKDNLGKFKSHWQRERHWTPRWIAPDDFFLALDKPLLLDPPSLTGKQRLFGMYRGYQDVDRTFAQKVLKSVPKGEDLIRVRRLLGLCEREEDDIPADIKKIESEIENETTRDALIATRLGQGKFREQVFSTWGNRCALTGCTVTGVLRASHIKPWSKCNNRERLDFENGLPLAAHIDALFENGLVTFDDEGRLLVSPELEKCARELLLGDFSQLTKKPSAQMKKYLAFHRQEKSQDCI